MPWKLYIDSRRRVKGSRGDSDTDFAIQLPYPLTVSGKAFIDVVLIPNSFKTIRAGQNDKIYLDETVALNKRVATLAPGQYSVFELKDALVTALNANKTITGQYQVAYNTASNRLVISLLSPASPVHLSIQKRNTGLVQALQPFCLMLRFRPDRFCRSDRLELF